MDAFELMRESAEFVNFFTSGKRVNIDECDDVDVVEEGEFDEDDEGLSLKKHKKVEKDDYDAMIITSLEDGNSKDSGHGSFTTSSTTTNNSNKSSSSSNSNSNSKQVKKHDALLDDIVEKRWQVEELDPFAMSSEFLEELKRLANKEQNAKETVKEVKNQQQKEQETLKKDSANSSSSNTTETPLPTLKPIQLSSSTSTATSITTNTYHRRSSNSSVKNEEKARKLMLQLDAIERAYTTNSMTINTPSCSPIKSRTTNPRSNLISTPNHTPSLNSNPKPNPTHNLKPTPLSPPISMRIIPERRSATRAQATIKQEAMSEKEIERFVKNTRNFSDSIGKPPVLATKSSAGMQSSLIPAVKFTQQSPTGKSTAADSARANNSNIIANISSNNITNSNSNSSKPPLSSPSPRPQQKHQRRPRPKKYATEEERKAASKASAHEFRQRYKDNETPEQREFRLKKSKVHRLLMKGRYEEAVEWAASEGIPLTAGQQALIEEALDSPKPTVSKNKSSSTSSKSSPSSKVIQIISTKKAAEEEKKSVAKVPKKRSSFSENDEGESAVTTYQHLFPKKTKKVPTHSYFGVDKAWDQLVMAQEVAKTTITRAGRQCKAKNWGD